MESLNALITGAGAPGIWGTIYSLRQQADFKLKLIGTDMRDEVVGKYLLDEFYQVPEPSRGFIDKIFEICEKEKVKIILPQVTNELEWFAKNKKKFEERGIKVLISDYESLVKANNKYELLKTCSENNIMCTGKYFLVRSVEELKEKAEEIGYPKKPFVVKLPVSRGMRGLRIIKNNFDSYKDFIENKPDNAIISLERLLSIFKNKDFPELLVTEYFPGEEYSVDVLANKGETIVCVPRKREVIRTGITFEGVTEKNEEIVDYCKRIVRVLKLDHIIGFQFKKDERGHSRILESNPRIQGTMIHSTFANCNIIAGAVKQAIFGDSGLKQENIIWGRKLKRYWGAIGDGKQTAEI